MEASISKTRLYKILIGMRTRCANPNDSHYRYYGGKGIKVCDAWSGENGVSNFCEWALQNGYADNLTIDRINPEGNYEPDNCRWITASENAKRIQPHDVKSINKTETPFVPTRESQMRATIKYAKENLKRIPFDVQKDKYEEIKAHAKKRGEKVNGFIKRAIDETIERDNSAGDVTSPLDE